jgi:tetratricopeptide (TPR) repeat protein
VRPSPGVDVRAGKVRFISRGRPASTPFQTPQLAGRNNGTEFLVEVEENRTVVTLFDGEAELSNRDTPVPVRLRSGQQGIAVAGKPIEVRAVIEAKRVVQWWIYYPGILDPDELELTPAERLQLAASLEAYCAGDLPTALKQYPGYPDSVAPATEAQRLYLASLMLSVGAVDRSERLLSQVNSNAPLAHALRAMIKAVTFPVGTAKADPRDLAPGEPEPGTRERESASGLLALSYALQATNNLRGALAAARDAVKRSKSFGFGWARVAELEFSFGHTRAAREAVEQALVFTPRNAQAHALRGFLLAAENRIQEVITAFDEAIRLDPALGNAWLGGGLCKRRLGPFRSSQHEAVTTGRLESSARKPKKDDWLSDLRMAAIVEPARSLLRSYLGKAFADAGLTEAALKELAVAKQFDPNDPTPWLYSALLNEQQNRFNEGIRDLEQSQTLNTNRHIYRSRFLLDQDRAVRSANLAQLYQYNEMTEVAVREANRAVESEYGNASAHLFLANSYDALRDPTRVELRYETPWFHELLLANLLSPVGGGRLSQFVSQQEYSKLLESDGLGGSILNEWRNDSELRSAASVFGTYGRTSFGFDGLHRSYDGDRPNSDDRRTEIYGQLKHEVTPNDMFYFLIKGVKPYITSFFICQSFLSQDQGACVLSWRSWRCVTVRSRCWRFPNARGRLCL